MINFSRETRSGSDRIGLVPRPREGDAPQLLISYER
jgi:hypothetical protein